MGRVTNDDNSSLELVRLDLLLEHCEPKEEQELFLDGGVRGEDVESDASLGHFEFLGRRELRLAVSMDFLALASLDLVIDRFDVLRTTPSPVSST